MVYWYKRKDNGAIVSHPRELEGNSGNGFERVNEDGTPYEEGSAPKAPEQSKRASTKASSRKSAKKKAEPKPAPSEKELDGFLGGLTDAEND